MGNSVASPTNIVSNLTAGAGYPGFSGSLVCSTATIDPCSLIIISDFQYRVKTYFQQPCD